MLSERFSGERVKIDDYIRVDGTLNYKLKDRQTLFLRVGNLFDARYETAFDRPGMPLTLAAGITLGS